MTSMEVQISSAWKFRVLIYSRVLDLRWNQWCWFLAFNSFAQCRENNSCEKTSYWRVREEIWAYRFSQFFEIKNRTGPKLVGLTRFRFFFSKKKLVWLFFIVKNRTEPKMITPATDDSFSSQNLRIETWKKKVTKDEKLKNYKGQIVILRARVKKTGFWIKIQLET